MPEFWLGVWDAAKGPVATAVAGLILALLGYALKWAKLKVKELHNEQVRGIVESLVLAAEQKFGAGEGQAKLDYVTALLASRGIMVDPADIEASVYWVSAALDNEKFQPPQAVYSVPQEDN